MDGVTGVPRLTGVLNEINSWYTNKAVLHQLRDITYSRETKWQIILPSNKMWGIRHRFLGSIDYLEKELAILDHIKMAEQTMEENRREIQLKYDNKYEEQYNRLNNRILDFVYH